MKSVTVSVRGRRVTVQSQGGADWAVVAEAAIELVGDIIELIKNKQVVEIYNEGTHDAHLWCASKQDRIGGEEGIWVKPGGKITFSFTPFLFTQFWCTMDYNGQRVGWDVYVGNWYDAPKIAKWSIRTDGVYDQWRNRIWRSLKS